MAHAPHLLTPSAFVRLVALLLLGPISVVALVPYPSNMDVLVATVEDAIEESLPLLKFGPPTVNTLLPLPISVATLTDPCTSPCKPPGSSVSLSL